MRPDAPLAPASSRARLVVYVGAATVGMDAGGIGYLMPAVRASFGMDPQSTSWLLTLFILGALVGAPLGASLAAARGDEFVLGMACVVFGIGGLVAGTATAFPVVLVGRLLQGLGAGPILPLAAALVTRLWPAERHGFILSSLSLAYGAAFLLQIACAPLLLRFGWRWIFLSAAAGATVVPIALRRLGRSPGGAFRWDGPGLATWCASLACLSVGINHLQGGLAMSPWVLAMTAAGLGLAVLFVVVESRSPAGMLPIATFRTRDMRVLLSLCIATGFGQVGVVQFPSVAVARLGLAPENTGQLMLPMVAAGFVGAVLIMVLLDRTGPKLLIGACAVTSVLGLLVTTSRSMGSAPLLWAAALVGLGVAGLSGGPLRYVAARTALEAQRENAQAGVTIFTNVGVLLGSALVGGIAGAWPDERQSLKRAMVVLALAMAALFLPVLVLGRNGAPRTGPPCPPALGVSQRSRGTPR